MSTADGLHTSGPSIASKIDGRPIFNEPIGVVTLAGTLTLTERYRPFLLLNGGAADRDVALPAVGASNGLVYHINNSGTTHNLVVKSGVATVVTLAPQAAASLVCDGVTWYSYGVATLETAESRVLTATGSITSAQLALLHSTPISMVAAPAAGLAIEPVALRWFLDHGAAGSPAFDAAIAGDVLAAKYTNGSGASLFDEVAGNAIGAATADYHTLVQPVPEVVPVAAAAVVASLGGAWGTSVSADTVLRWRMLYRVRTLAFGA